MTLCEESCDLVDYNFETEKAKCSCEVKTSVPLVEEIKIDGKKLFKKFIDINNIANIKLMKCYKTVFKGKHLKHNIGFFIYVSIFFIYFISLILFSSKYFFSIKKDIDQILKAKSSRIGRKSVGNFENLPTSALKKEKRNTIKLNINNNKKRRKSKIKNNFPPKKNARRISNIIKENKRLSLQKSQITSFSQSKITLNKRKSIKLIRIFEYNDNELNSLEYEKAIIEDKRSCLQYYISLILEANSLLFSFYCRNKDLNSQIIKIFLFFFFFSIDFVINALFFSDDTMHKIYEDEGKFNFLYQIPQIIYSTLIGYIINSLIKFLSLSENNILEFKRAKFKSGLITHAKKLLKILKIKFTFFFIITFLLLLFCLYYITCFCGIYVNTQYHLIKDSLISFALSLLYPFVTCLIPCIFRFIALKAKKKDKDYLYKFSKFIQDI